MDIKDIIKELNHICEDIYELHNCSICNKLFKLNNHIKPHIDDDLYNDYTRKIETIFFDSFINQHYDNIYNEELNILILEIVYYISKIITMLNNILLNYP